MTAIIIFAVVLLIFLTRVGVTAEYSSDGFSAVLNIAFFRIKIYPRRPELNEKKAGGSKSKSTTQTAETSNKKGGFLPEFWGIIEIAANTLGRLRKKLLINELIISYTAASDDPFDTVMAYGRASAGIASVYPVLDNIFHIKHSKFYTSVNFEATKPVIYVRLKISISIIAVLYIASALLRDYFKVKKAEDKLKRLNTNEKNTETKDINRKVDSNG